MSKKKKSNNLLKGVAAAGAVVGGGTIFAGNNAVYAAENDQAPMGVQSQSEGQYIESQSASQSQTTSYTDSESDVTSYSAAPAALSAADQVSVAQDAPSTEGNVETVVADQNSVGTNVESKVEGVGKQFADAFKGLAALGQGNVTLTAEGQEGTNKGSASNNESVSLSVSGSMSGSLAEVGSQISQESVTANTLKSEMLSASASTSLEYGSASASLSASASQSESNKYTSESQSISTEFNAASEAFNSEKNETLEDLIPQINASKARLAAIRQKAIDNGNGEKLGSDYQDEADNLAVLLAKYSFFQKYGVGKITKSSYDYNNHAPYWDSNRNNFFIKYENKDKSESHVGYFDWVGVTEKKDANGNVKYEFVQYNEVDPVDVVQIAIVKKAPIYSNSSTYFYFYEDKGGNITGYIKNSKYGSYKKMESFKKKDIEYDTGDEIRFSYNGKTYELKVHKDNSMFPNTYPNERYPNFGEVPDDLNISKYDTTTKGNYFFSITDYDKKETEYDSMRSNFTSVSEKQSQHLSNSIKKKVKVLVKA